MSGSLSSLFSTRLFTRLFGRTATVGDYRTVLVLSLVTLLNCWIVGSRLLASTFPPNDSKHWLLRARYYAGLPMPTSELPGQFATHPFSILLLAAVLVVVGVPILAAKLWTLGAYLGATAAVYVTARELFSRRVALVAYVAVSCGQYLYFDLLSWGGIPNLIAVGLLTLAVGALARARRTETLRDRVLLGVVVGFGLFAHPPSSPVLVAGLGCAGVGLALATRDHGVLTRTLVDVALPVTVFLVYVASLWQIFVTYTDSTGGHSIAVIWRMLLRNPPMFLAFAIALAGLPILFLRPVTDDGAPDDTTATEGFGSAAVGGLTLGWLVGPVVLAGVVTLLPSVQTELARVTYYLAAPMCVLVAVYVETLAQAFTERTADTDWELRLPGVSSSGAAVAVVVFLLITPAFFVSVTFYDNALSYYAIDNQESILAVVQWIDGQQPFEGRVAGSFGIVPWVKALTGQDGLTPTPASGSYRPDEAAEREAFLTLERLRTEGDTPENLAAASAVIEEYDVHYLVAPNNWRASRYGTLGARVYETDALVIVDFTAPPERSQPLAAESDANAHNDGVASLADAQTSDFGVGGETASDFDWEELRATVQPQRVTGEDEDENESERSLPVVRHAR
ncbi:glycosyltransferase family protein [Halogranum rubrum]|uniref:Uncharacterized protein n=1 Tax=Halogranum salarium B-1 TaxID=1210908 RepID=J2ZVV5_9EURY|nr:glycosyltransferase family 39 protein [Halogranum salarium]EJN57158.1 hypothetical protein HSB1_45440 [Halogranum salarium B-1]